MELVEAFKDITGQLSKVNEELGFKKCKEDEVAIYFKGEKGIYRLVYDASSSILQFECSYEDNGDQTEFNTISRSLFELDVVNERDVKSMSNEITDELERLFKVRKPVNLDKVKMPKSVSRTKAKNGLISYDVDSLANRFGALYPEFKDVIKQNVVDYGEFLPEDFFTKYGTPKVLEVIKLGTEAERKKLFKMLGEVFEDGTNEVQDIIAVTILGEMRNDKELLEIADKYMTEYMAGPVHEVNKLTGKKNKYTRRLQNPPAYKPSKRKSFSLGNQLGK